MGRYPVTRFVSRLHTRLRKKLQLGHSLSELEPSLVAEKLLFRAPPLEPALAETVELISPQFRLQPHDEASRRFWELNQNGLCWGEFRSLESVLRYNEMENFEIFDAQSMGSSLARLPGPYDLIYSFFAIGFHWSIGLFLDELLGLMTERSIAIFTLHDRFEDFSELGDTPYRVVEFRSSWPRGWWSRLLVLAKDEAMLENNSVALA
jgi:hypothetical protein